jgi:hypothetical protein
MFTLTKTIVASGTIVVGAVLCLASVPPARAALEAVMSCAQTTPCLEWDNSKSGDAVKGVSTKGNALHGQTKFKSAGQTAGRAGVLGEDLSTSGNLNAGVSGISNTGTGVTGTSTSWNGMAGFASAAGVSGVYGQNSAATGFGLAGRNTATTHNGAGAGILADGGAANDGLHAIATGGSGVALYAFSQAGTALFANQGAGVTAPELYLQDTSSSNNAIIQAVGPSGNVLDLKSDHMTLNADLLVQSADGAAIIGTDYTIPPLNVYGGGSNTNFEVFSVNDEFGNQAMGVSDIGTVSIAGLLFTQGSCNSGCLQGNKRVRAVKEYAPVEAEPTIEDNGEATTVNGIAKVALDSKFANVIDAGAPYLVTVTPEGDCNGLYVTDRSARGFEVRELRGGSSSVGFAYRIVAKRFGISAPRLPMTAVAHHTVATLGPQRHR